MNGENKLLTIGQFAAMHGINKKTLMWYDEIGLFQPAYIHPDNGYRYYDYHQSPILETILLLRELDVSIQEIQTFMKNRSAASMKNLLEDKILKLDRNILHLQAVRNTLNNHRKNMNTLLNMDLSEICILEKEACCLITVEINQDTTFEEEVELVTAKTTEYQLGRLHDASYGSMIPVTSLLQGQFDDYCNIFIEIPLPTQKEKQIPRKNTGLHMQPGGRYLRAFHRGNWDTIPLRYQEILDFAQKQKLTLSGFSYEKGINENVIDRMEDYIVQIEIPIQSM